MLARELSSNPLQSPPAHLRAYNAEALEFHGAMANYEPQRLEAIVRHAASAYANKPFLTTALPNGISTTLTFADVERQSANLARYFREVLKLAPGTVVAIQSPNCISYVVCLLGVMRAGLVLSNVNPLYTETETRRQLRDCKAQVLIGSIIFADTIDAATAGTDVKHVISLSLTDFSRP